MEGLRWRDSLNVTHLACVRARRYRVEKGDRSLTRLLFFIFFARGYNDRHALI